MVVWSWWCLDEEFFFSFLNKIVLLLQKMYFKSGVRDPRGEDDGGRNVDGDAHNYPSYSDRSATLGDVRRQAYRHGSDRVLVVELERQNGARAATLHVAKRRRDRYPSDTRRVSLIFIAR